jgi:hypothetical protein
MTPAVDGIVRQVPTATVASTGNTVERWGWELRTAPEPARVATIEDPPTLPVLDAAWANRLVRRRATAVRRWRRYGRLAVWTSGLAALGWILQWRFGEPAGRIAVVLTGVTAVWLYLTARPIVIRRLADIHYRRWRVDILRAHTDFDDLLATWNAAGNDSDHSAEEVPRWEPIQPAARQRVDIVGGDIAGWTSLLTAATGSMLESGTAVTLMDLSGHGIGTAVATGTCAGPSAVAQLPRRVAGGPGSSALASAVAEAIAAVTGDPSQRAVDTNLLLRVSGCLEAPPTYARLAVAVHVVASRVACPESLDQAEYRALTTLLGDSARRAAEARFLQIASVCDQLAAVESDSDGAPPAGDLPLQVWELTDRLPDLTAEVLTQVSVQILLHQLRDEPGDDPGGARHRSLVVVGADRLARGVIERLDQVTRRRGIRLVMAFEHLRDDVVDVLGAGEAVMFMRLGNAKEAEAAANHIGREHRLVASQFTASRSMSSSTTAGRSFSTGTSEQGSSTEGEQTGWSRNFRLEMGVVLPHNSGSRSGGRQTSTTTGTGTSSTDTDTWSYQDGYSVSESVSYQRVYEYTVTPTFLQCLSPTAFVLVDPGDPGSPRLGDCGVDPTHTDGEAADG